MSNDAVSAVINVDIESSKLRVHLPAHSFVTVSGALA